MDDTVPVLELLQISKQFSGLQALREVSFTVRRGTITALIGPNGAGKSTVFNLVSGLDRQTSGTLLFDGSDIGDLPAFRRPALGLARIFQTPRIFEYLSVLENVMVGFSGRLKSDFFGCGLRLSSARREEHDMIRDSTELLGFVGLEDLRHRPAGTLAFGGQRLLEFARALATRPKLLLLDEPTAGLTPAETDAFAAMLKTLLERGVTTLIVEHDINFITSISDKVVVLAYGEKIFEGRPIDLRSEQRVIDAYLGPRRMRDAEG